MSPDWNNEQIFAGIASLIVDPDENLKCYTNW